MRDVVNELRSNPSRLDRMAATPSTPSYTSFQPEPYQPGSIRINEPRTGSLQSLKTLNIQPDRGRTSPPIFNNEYNPMTSTQPSFDQEYASMDLGGMDWSPAQFEPKSQHRAFTENLPINNDAVFLGQAQPQKNTKLFGQSPVAPQAGTFWFKVPPAPTTPAQQLRNPPNQPRMRTVSQEQKQNFFHKSRSAPTQERPERASFGNHGSQQNEVDFAKQKFFAPESPSEGHDDLVSALSGWSLGDSNRQHDEVVEKSKARTHHVGQGIALIVALIFWNQALNNPSEHTKNIILAILFGCLCIGARTILENTIYTVDDKQSVENAVLYTFGTLLGGLECSASLYGLLQILGGTECDNCGPLGTALLGGMLVHQIWVASFG
jgi:hypothetical protein